MQVLGRVLLAQGLLAQLFGHRRALGQLFGLLYEGMQRSPFHFRIEAVNSRRSVIRANMDSPTRPSRAPAT